MMPVGRMTMVRTFPKAELLRAMNFVVMPALMGPLLGPTVGGLIVHWASWREMFFVNIPVGLLALAFGWRHMPDYRDERPQPLDVPGLLLFGGGTALLSWVLEVFGSHELSGRAAGAWLLVGAALVLAYGWHARRWPAPLMNLALFRVRTFRVSVLGGFVTRLGVGGMPFLLPLLYQVGMGLPAWHSGLLMMPAAAAAIAMKSLATGMLGRFGYRRVLQINTVAVALCMALFTQVGPGTPTALIVLLGAAMGLANSLQFTSMNSMAYADLEARDSADGSSIASTFQQLSMSFGLACGALVAGYFLERPGATGAQGTLVALHAAFLVLAGMTLASSLVFRTLHPHDGDQVSRPATAG
jgi:MFS family permease